MLVPVLIRYPLFFSDQIIGVALPVILIVELMLQDQDFLGTYVSNLFLCKENVWKSWIYLHKRTQWQLITTIKLW